MVSSQDKQRKQKTSQGGSSQHETVHTSGAAKAQSLKVVRTKRDVHEVWYESLMEQVVQKDNMKKNQQPYSRRISSR